MYAMLPYFWIVFMLGLVVATIAAAMMGRPKKATKKAQTVSAEAVADPMTESEPMLDFGDELAQNENK
jgi:uncharacterized membrane protein YgaE (UPF0421/DUF939 family)